MKRWVYGCTIMAEVQIFSFSGVDIASLPSFILVYINSLLFVANLKQN